MNGATLREYATDAIKFWERGRIYYNLFLYNLFLATIVVLHFMAGCPASKYPAVT